MSKRPSKKGMRPVIVTCAADDDCVEHVAERLREVGFHVDSVLEFAGSVLGEWAHDLEELRNIPGVAAGAESEEKYPQ